MVMLRALLFLAAILVSSHAALAQHPEHEDQQKKCEAILKSPAAAECRHVFAKKADCCIQYDTDQLAAACKKMSTINIALTCFSETHEIGFWKTDLTDENEPGPGAQHAEQWKRNVMRECSKEGTKSDAIDCAILQKSGTKFVYGQKNGSAQRQASEQDPIFKFCRRTFGDYWEGVEECVKQQRAAKRRMGQ